MKEIEPISTLDNLFEFTKQLTEKEILIILSNLVLEVSNFDILKKITNFINKHLKEDNKKSTFTVEEIKYIDYLNATKDYKKEAKTIVNNLKNEKDKKKINKKINLIGNKVSFGYFAFS